MVKDNDNGVVGFQFHQRDDSTKWQKFQRALYDPSTKQVLGRTPKSWGQLLFFYAMFYIVLAALFAICMQGLFATISVQEPTWKLEESLIGNNPGLGFRPISDKTEDGSLIWYNTTNHTTTTKWVKLMNTFLEDYNKSQVGENYVQCDFHKLPEPDQACAIDIGDFGNCTPEKNYGYNSTSPCVFLKLNRIFGWKPEFFTEPQDDMPIALKEHINSIINKKERQQIWVSCQGENALDKESATQFEYKPHGFAGYFYPYLNTPNYKSPLISVRILNPTPNIIISIECRAWAKNIVYRGGSLNRAGSVSFEIMVDTEGKANVMEAKI
ncbi:unnamed protein product [Brassicogethes aeneus]|uniref:Uncharacterized protein n=1 Tax=Brassicogethes aeneus TaxID=1431903 RepID=A0A9P0B9R2_BRAAE|nr:unnamed protein product [Brassicogethes aeneus]